MYESVTKLILAAQTVAVFMHINPDGDCVSSALATCAFLKKMGKTAHCFLEDNNVIRDNLSCLPNVDSFNKESLKNYDLGIAVDCGAAGRLGNNCFKRFSKCEERACIDHHASSTPFVEAIALEPKAASTTQILYKIFREIDVNLIDKDIATLLFAGIITDSGGMSFSSTTTETFWVAYELSKYGVDTYALNRKLVKDTKMEVYNLRNRVLSKTKFYFNNTVGIISFLDEDFSATNTRPDDTDGMINNLIDIIGVKIAISVAMVDGQTNAFKIGIRTKDGVNAGACAEYFGGGGHFNASGCRIYSSYEETIAKLLKIAEHILNA